MASFVRLSKKPENRLLPIFSPDFTLNCQIWLFNAEKWIFVKKIGTLLNSAAYDGSLPKPKQQFFVEKQPLHGISNHPLLM